MSFEPSGHALIIGSLNYSSIKSPETRREVKPISVLSRIAHRTNP